MQRASVCTMHPAARPGMQSHAEASLTARVFPDVYGMLGRQLQVPTSATHDAWKTTRLWTGACGCAAPHTSGQPQ